VIKGVGIDVIDVKRFKKKLQKNRRLVIKIFTDGEREYCNKMADRYLHLASRFCAKEAFLKAIGTGLSKGISWRDIEVKTDTEGQPFFLLHARAKTIASKRGYKRIFLSLSHIKDIAVAVVLLE
jgi:holo-[acyl-carrier protein] synthase